MQGNHWKTSQGQSTITIDDLKGHHQKQQKSMDATTHTLQQPHQGNYIKSNGAASQIALAMGNGHDHWQWQLVIHWESSFWHSFSLLSFFRMTWHPIGHQLILENDTRENE